MYQYKLWMASQTVLIHSTMFYTQKCLQVNLICWSAAEVYSVKIKSTEEEEHERITWTNFTAYSLNDSIITVVILLVVVKQNNATLVWGGLSTDPTAVSGKIVWQVFKNESTDRFQEQHIVS